MRIQFKNLIISFVLVFICLFSSGLRADEGMWLFNALPRDYLKQQYDFEPDQAWADHLMRSSVRLNIGGSGSFVSSDGLVLTNHHVGSDTIQKLSTPEADLMKLGFYARKLEEELKAPDLELNALVSIIDVTERIQKELAGIDDPAQAAVARRGLISTIAKEATDATGNRCDVVELYGGGRYHLYEYKRYTDVRLVWAPELAAAYFGGDADNFEYPRYCLDAAIFRVYEDERPAKIEHFLRWNDAGPAEGELVFVSGHPGSTKRIYTHAALEFERDVRMPIVLDFIRRREILLQQFGLRGAELKRQANDELLSFQNSRKAYTGMLAGLQDPMVMEQKASDEAKLIEQIKGDMKLADYAEAWRQIAEIQEKYAELQRQSISLNTRIFNVAHTFVQMADEDQKPNAERLAKFSDAARESLKQQLLSAAAFYLDLERVKLTDLLARIVERRGGNDELVKRLLNGQSPQARVSGLLAETQIHDPEFRRQLFEGGSAQIQASSDPMLEFARLIDPEIRRLNELSEALDEIETQAYAKISEALFATRGTTIYPDATFTLRLAFGTVKGYEQDGEPIPAWTTMGQAFEHELAHNAEGDFKLPESWHAAKDRFNHRQPYNFVCTADIIGGNSGSPVVNRAGELVGLIFDGNIQSLTSDFFFSDTQARATSVHAGAIREALRNIYGAADLADALGK
ncbi:MAG TPA: S46 family peptidase [Pirellulaceae bacterium]|nr:S46 family peptidase [Pirellulaceae bacterium]HMO91836.1 S46 family peptidase [Pirellulaceae bacterium]HMP69899.1 S46 family peptidase [Pirellulaceae bacterium]